MSSFTRKLTKGFTKVFSKQFAEIVSGIPSCAVEFLVSWFKNLNVSLEDSVGDRSNTIYYGQYLAQNSIINFYRTSGTFDYINPQTGASVSGVSIPIDGLYTVPADGVCEIITSDGSYYPVCERSGNILHDVVNGVHLSVSSTVWAEFLYGSDYLNQEGYIDKTTSDNKGYSWTSIVNGISTPLDNNCLIPLRGEDENLQNTLDSSINTYL